MSGGGRAGAELALKRLALALLPARLVYWLWHLRRRGRRRSEDGTAIDLRSIAVQEGVRLDVYWSEVDLGPGPSASLWVLGEEVLRLDCFDGARAHMHLNPVQINLALPWSVTPRLHFPPDKVERQIERGAFELERNAGAVLLMNQLDSVRRVALAPGRLAAAAAEMRRHMAELLARHGGPAAAGGGGTGGARPEAR